MNTMWEVLWHQSGTATRLVRWEKDMKVRVHGVGTPAHRAHALRALREAAAEAGVKVIDISAQADATQQANVTVEITANDALSDNQPCETVLEFRSESTIDSAVMKMREREVARCAHHEAMHVMGVRGHPEGDTVLSYFAKKVDGLQPLDKAMLRGWYSTAARGGMTPFEVLPLLTEQLVAITPHKNAVQARQQFLARTIGEMEAFADGKADVPSIVRKSGKCSEHGVRYGRAEMGYFLGVAYRDGRAVNKDEARATGWLERAATMGSPSARALATPTKLAVGNHSH
jgi:TPR repeat protein